MIVDILGREYKEGQTVVVATFNQSAELEFRKVQKIEDGKVYLTNKRTTPTLKPEKWLIIYDPNDE